MEAILIIGAGPAGLAAAYELVRSKKRYSITIVDKNSQVGGLARTEEYKKCLFDVGPHRFYTKNPEVKQLWHELLGKKFIKVKRSTKMLYQNKLFQYPISIKDVATKLSPIELIYVITSFIQAKISLQKKPPISFEDYIVKHFGRKMFNIFFKTYTEKIWGIKCNQISAKWASQRIKNLNLWEVIVKSLFNKSKSNAKSLVEEFNYPTKGAGFMYETLAKKLKSKGVKIILNADVSKIISTKNKISKVEYIKNNKKITLNINYLLSSMPLTKFVVSFSPTPPKSVLQSANKIYFRDHITVNLITKSDSVFNENWIYVHDPRVQMARVSNYNSMSKEMTKNKQLNAISVEYFAFRSDKLWKTPDIALKNLAINELRQTKLLSPDSVVDGFVVRELDSYPVYYTGHEEYFENVKNFVSKFSNLELVGRGGMFKYNNMDHSIYSGMLGARNIIAGKRLYDPWLVNEDAEYLEQSK